MDGGLIVRGAEYVTLRDFEVFRTRGGAYRYKHLWGEPTPKVICGVGAENQEYKLNEQLLIAYQSRGLHLINLYLHDNPAGGGVGCWNPAEDMLVYGCLLIRNACDDERRGHGHGAYIQNGWPPEQYGKSAKVFKHNISAYNRSTGMKSYGESPGVRGTHFLGNVFFGNGMTSCTNWAANYLAGSLKGPMEDIVLRDNHSTSLTPPPATSAARSSSATAATRRSTAPSPATTSTAAPPPSTSATGSGSGSRATRSTMTSAWSRSGSIPGASRAGIGRTTPTTSAGAASPSRSTARG